jgi:hypothetical protein
MDTITGLMTQKKAAPTVESNMLMEQIKAILAPTRFTIEERLAAMSDSDRKVVLQTAKTVSMAMRMRVAAGDQTMGYAEVAEKMYSKMDVERRSLIAAILNATSPLSFSPERPKQKQYDGMSLYEKPHMQITERATTIPVEEISTEVSLADIEPNKTSEPFMSKLIQSESSGKSDAEFTIADGRRFVGALQFGDARLRDYQAATGSSFTQDEFKANTVLQDKVASWHAADIDKAIDALGDKAAQYNRDGLRAVAHLGGKGGMKKHVHSKGSYNPADELGTSLQDYYDKFAVQS